MQIFRRFTRRKDETPLADARKPAQNDERAGESAARPPRTALDELRESLAANVSPADAPHRPINRSDPAPRDPALRGVATVARITPSGPDLDGARVYDLLLHVELPEREPYQFLHRQLIADASLGSWKPGSQLSVRVLADNPNDLIVVG